MPDGEASREGEGAKLPAGEGKAIQVLARSDNMEGLLVTVEPGTDWGEAYTHLGEEIRYVLEGTLEVDIAGKKYLLKEGDCLWHTAEVPHKLRNPGSRAARYFVVIIPPSFS